MQQRDKKILITTGIFPPDIGGPATYSTLLLKELPGIGYRVNILTYGHRSQSSEYVFIVSNYWPKGIRHLIYFIKAILLSRDVDFILAADSSFGAALISVVVAKLFRKKIIVRVTGDYVWEQGRQRLSVTDKMDEFQDNKKLGIFIKLLRGIQNYYLNNATKIIVPSEYLKKVVSKWKIDISKIEVIHNGFDSKFITNYERNDNPQITITSIGRLVPWKGFGNLLEVFSELIKIHSNIELNIVGDGPEKNNLLNRSKELNINNKVNFLGRLSHDDILKKLQPSDIFVLNTDYEGFSHVILEAMAIGLPVVVSRVGGNPEVIEDGKNGFLFGYLNNQELFNKLNPLINDKKLRLEIGRQAKLRVDNFSQDKMLLKLDKLISSL